MHIICRHIPDVALFHFEPHRYRVGNLHPKRDMAITNTRI